MAYKSLLTVLTDTRLAPAPLEQSIALAARHDAHDSRVAVVRVGRGAELPSARSCVWWYDRRLGPPYAGLNSPASFPGSPT